MPADPRRKEKHPREQLRADSPPLLPPPLPSSPLPHYLAFPVSSFATFVMSEPGPRRGILSGETRQDTLRARMPGIPLLPFPSLVLPPPPRPPPFRRRALSAGSRTHPHCAHWHTFLSESAFLWHTYACRDPRFRVPLSGFPFRRSREFALALPRSNFESDDEQPRRHARPYASPLIPIPLTVLLIYPAKQHSVGSLGDKLPIR